MSVRPSSTPPAPPLSEGTWRSSTTEAYQHHRFYGILGWQPPSAALDHAEWTDAASEAPITLLPPPDQDPSHWEAVTGPGTSPEGWVYGTVFAHLPSKRPGGRATPRLTDIVRRRLWRTRPGQGDQSRLPEVGSAATSASTPSQYVLNQARLHDAEAKRKAFAVFLSMGRDMLQRRRAWELLPWDPTAPFWLWQKHQAIYKALESQALERQLFTSAQGSPPSPLRRDRTLLQEALAAAAHARAAYGYAAAAGVVSSVREYVQAVTVHSVSFDAVAGASVEANNESVALLTGVDPSDVLHAEWSNSTCRPCHYVALDRAAECVVLAIRGSLQLGDLLSDAAAQPMEASLCGAQGHVHQGIFAAATYVHCATAAALAEAGRRRPGWPLVLAGHSLGGGTAALVALLLTQGGLPPGLAGCHAFTFGAAATVSAGLLPVARERVTSFVLGQDLVPHLSFASVQRLMIELSEISPVRRAARGIGKKLSSALGIDAEAWASGDPRAAWASLREAGQGMARRSGLLPRQAGGEAALELSRAAAVPVLAEDEDGGLSWVAGARGGEEVPILSEEVGRREGGLEGSKGELPPSRLATSAPSCFPTSAPSPSSDPAPSIPGAPPDRLPDPETLHAAGRLLWIFPGDEAGHAPPPAGAAARVSRAPSPSLEMPEAGARSPADAAPAEPPALPRRGRGEASRGDAVAATSPRPSPEEEESEDADAFEGVLPSTPGRRRVSMGEAEAAVGAGGGQGPGSQSRQTRAALAEVEAASFEHLLWLPNAISDHLPSRYLEVLQRL